MSIDSSNLRDALDRKDRLGVSFSELGRRTGASHTAISRLLNNVPTAIAMDRARLLRRVNRALDEIEAEMTENGDDGESLVTAEPIP